ncbi:MAG: hypothetical protein M3R40_03270 [Pseudomonadota bacterium]|nr:hypothetical protein [Pseudomonadota bacterium]
MPFATDNEPLPFGPWNPDIQSEIPDAIRHLCTFLRTENVFTSAAAAAELRDFTGLELSDVVAFRPERLALHELLIRVTADLCVPDGSRIEDLGINFRQITRAILSRYVGPRMETVAETHHTVRHELSILIEREAAALFEEPAVTPAAKRPRKFAPFAFLARSRANEAVRDAGANREMRIAAEWEAKAHASTDPLQASAYRALARVLSAVLVRHGRVWGSREMIATLATDIASNHCASDAIGQLIEPWLLDAAKTEGYRRLPRQEHPVVMNTKGASASGKSSLRPLQKKLANEIGVDWREFALISPDIWRKQLLDYGTLGPHYKYAGAFTGEELKIVDQKLDRYMARKAARVEMPHLLIDRFRFDSFAPHSDEAGSNLLTRFGQILYLFFMITPPASLVERAWNRGLEVGRYKAVDDTLAHGVEAYSGMPEFFFTWVQRPDKRVHFEFLDNSVRLPERPRTVAFGWNDTMNILDVGCLLDVERYRRVNIDATAPESLYADDASLAPAGNAGFLRQCIDRFRELNFADQATGRIYLCVNDGRPAWADREALACAIADADTRAGLEVTLQAAFDRALPSPERPVFLDEMMRVEPIRTLGDWGRQHSSGDAGVRSLPAPGKPAAHRA